MTNYKKISGIIYKDFENSGKPDKYASLVSFLMRFCIIFLMTRVFTFDLHTHALEKKADSEKYWQRARETGLDGTASAEHADYNPKEAYFKLLEKKPEDMILIPGIEVNSEVGHILAYYHTEEIYEIRELLKKDIAVKRVLEIGEENNLLVSLSHPWGFSYDSIAYLYGAKKTGQLVLENNIGVEVYNGMIGHLSNFIYDSGWIKRPINFLDFLEKNRVASRIGITRLSSKLKGRIDRERLEVVQRSARTVELGNLANFVTAGSDSHSAERVGAGIIKLRLDRNRIDNKTLLKELQNKEQVIWSGPLVREVEEGMFEKVDDPLKRMEIVQGIRYATAKAVRKVSIKEKITKRVGKKAISKKIKKFKTKISK